MFELKIGLEVDEAKYEINRRTAARAVVQRDHQLLMIKTNKGDYKFPGGGVEEETIEAALRREICEESGYQQSIVKEEIGRTIETNLDQFNEDSLFIMTSHYYMCEVKGTPSGQLLDDYEEALEFKPVWISLDEAINNNLQAITKPDHNPWVMRETLVLKTIKKRL